MTSDFYPFSAGASAAMSQTRTPTHQRVLKRAALAAAVLVPTAFLPAAVAQAQALTPGQNTASGRLTAFSEFRIGTDPSVQDARDADYYVEGNSFTSVGRGVASMVAGGPGARGRSGATSWAVAGAAGVFADALGAGDRNLHPDMLNSGHARSEATARWWDSVRITDPGVANGSRGRLTAHLTVSGNLNAVVSEFFSQSHAAFSVNGEGLAPVGGFNVSSGCSFDAAYCTYTSAGGFSGWADGTREHGSRTIAVSVPFVFGTEFYLGFTVSAMAWAQGASFTGNQTLAQASALADFGNSVVWGGIDGIYRGGSLITSYDIASASGTDFRFAVTSPVPEASPASLLLIGLAALHWMTRRRRPG